MMKVVRLGFTGGGFDRRAIDLLAEAEGDVLGDRCARRGRYPARWSRSASAASRGSTRARRRRQSGCGPRSTIVDAVDQLGQRASCRSRSGRRWRSSAPGAARKETSLSTGVAAVAERDMVEDDLAAHRRGDARAFSSSSVSSVMRSRMRRAPASPICTRANEKVEIMRREAKHAHQPHVGHQFADRDAVGRDIPDAMQQRAAIAIASSSVGR